MIDISDLIGCRFKVHGRDKNGFDCYGLVIEVEKRYGREMVDLLKDYTKSNYMLEINENAFSYIDNNKLKKTDKLEEGNVILFFDEKGRATHVGVYLKKRDFIHCDGLGVRVTNLDTYFRKSWEVYCFG